MRKIYPLSELKDIIEKEKRRGRKIILTNGCFDLIHVGHIRYLKEAKEKGDILIVALNSDESVRKIKSQGRPILNERERAEIISSFYFVDYVTIFLETNVEKVLLTLKPDIHAKGSDYTLETVPEKDVVKQYGGKTEITGGPKIKSTSNIIKEIKNRFS